MGLLDHVVQRLQLSAQQQRTQRRTDRAAEQQPAEAAERALPQLGDSEHRVADHLDPRRLLPATTDDRIPPCRFQADQLDEPVRHVGHRRNAVAFDQRLVVRQIDHADAGVIPAVENRTDQQLDHRRVVDVRRQRQRQRRRGVLRM
ncbi:hypothetical protein D3C73_828470 [compost metagenome]